jgi:hypothetical protein
VAPFLARIRPITPHFPVHAVLTLEDLSQVFEYSQIVDWDATKDLLDWLPSHYPRLASVAVVCFNHKNIKLSKWKLARGAISDHVDRQ